MKIKGSLGAILSLAALFIFDGLIEMNVLPMFFRDISIPFKASGKPIGSALFSLTFFHLFLIVLNILAISYVLNRFGFKNNVYPSSREGKMDFIMIMIFSLSGLAMWYYPIFLILFISTGAYFVDVELK